MDSSKDEVIFVIIEGKGWVNFCLNRLVLIACDVREVLVKFMQAKLTVTHKFTLFYK